MDIEINSVIQLEGKDYQLLEDLTDVRNGFIFRTIKVALLRNIEQHFYIKIVGESIITNKDLHLFHNDRLWFDGTDFSVTITKDGAPLVWIDYSMNVGDSLFFRFVKAKEVKLRPSWDDYFFRMLEIIESRSTCLRRHVGAIVIRDNRILATGYNGPPPGIEHCDKLGCIREELEIPSGERHELCRAIHAEQNAICQAARFGISLEGATMYTNLLPCSICAKMIASVGIVEVKYKGEYNDTFSRKMLKNVKLTKVI